MGNIPVNHFSLEKQKLGSGQPSIKNLSDQKLFPVTDIIDDGKSYYSSIAKENLIFCHKVVINTINACLENKYSVFDAITTTHCCHGMAILVRDLILSIRQLDLENLCKEGKRRLKSIEEAALSQEYFLFTWFIPKSLLDLTSLYILGFVREEDPQRRAFTDKVRLKLISPLSRKFCYKVVNNLQKKISNKIARNYCNYLNYIRKDMLINGALIHSWGKYIKPEYLRSDKFGVQYASNLFSMQVSLGYLIYSRAKIAIVNDFISSNGNVRERYIRIFQGDGKEQLVPMDAEETRILATKQDEPIIVFGGCLYSDHLEINAFNFQINPWINQISSLVLACDVAYPQFPKASDDPEFDRSPIEPQEVDIKKIIDKFSKIPGVSANDPSLFCLAHIYPASVGQVLKVLMEENKAELPFSALPINILQKNIAKDLPNKSN